MPYRTSYRKKTFKPRRTTRKKTFKRRPNRASAARTFAKKQMGSLSTDYLMNRKVTKVIKVTKTALAYNVINGGGANVAQNVNWSLNDVPDSTNYRNVYRQYKIVKIKNIFRLDNVELTDNAIVPRMFARYNYDYTPAVPTIANMQEFNNLRVMMFSNTDRVHTVTVYPRLMDIAYVSGTATLGSSLIYGTEVIKPKWMNVDDFATPHYGLSYYIDNLPTGMNILHEVEFTVLFKDNI